MDQHATDLLTDWAALRPGVPPVWARYTDLIVERAIGSWIETLGGERYLDYTCGIGVTNTGHAHPRVVAAIAEQAASGIHLQQNIVYHQPGLELHRRLPQRFPNAAAGIEYGLFLSNSGAEAVEAAMKLAKAATRRPVVISFRGGFHGRTHGAMALTSSSVKYRAHFEPLMGGVQIVPYPYPLRMGGTDAALATTLSALDELFDRACRPTTSPRSSSSPSSVRVATSCRPTASCRRCASSPIGTASSLPSTRCSRATAAPVASSPPSGATSHRTS